MKKLFLLMLLLAGMSQAQTAVTPIVNSHVQLFNGAAPCSGCLLDTFSAGTTTPLVTYSESTGTTPNANPVVLDASGQGVIYLTLASYKFRLRTAAGATLWTQDNVSPVTPLSTFAGITSTGNVIIKPSTAATSLVNQSSPTHCLIGFYFNVSSLQDQWCFQVALGTGASPTSTLTISHAGSGGAAAISVPANLAAPSYADKSAAPAQSGVLRAGNNVTAVAARNAAGNADLNLLGTDASNNAVIGPQIRQTEQGAPLGVNSNDLIWADNVAHRWKMNNNNGGQDSVVGAATTDTLTGKTYGGATLNKQIFTSNGTFTIPANITSVKVTLCGGGGGGGATNNVNSGAGGGAGGAAVKWLSGLTPGNTIAVTVGGAGTGGSAGANNGNAGGNTSIASGTQTITTVTGNGGGGGNFNSFGGAGGAASSGDQNFGGNTGGFPVNSTTAGGFGAASIFGGTPQIGFSGSGLPGGALCAGGSGAGSGGGSAAGGSGLGGVVVFEWTN